MVMSGLNPVIDTLREILEPTSEATVNLDLSCAPPVEYAPNTLYLWPSGRADDEPFYDCRQTFELTALYVVDDDGELDKEERERAISDLMDDKAHEYIQKARDNRVNKPRDQWADLRASIDYDNVHALQCRGIAVRFFGYRYP